MSCSSYPASRRAHIEQWLTRVSSHPYSLPALMSPQNAMYIPSDDEGSIASAPGMF